MMLGKTLVPATAGKIVVHYLDGALIKGHSTDLFPNKPTFHIAPLQSEEISEVRLSDLKAVFYVKDFEGRPGKPRHYELERPGLGRRVRLKFRDGEVIEGYTNGYSPNRLAFFVFPPDPEDNTERILVVTQATVEVKLV